MQMQWRKSSKDFCPCSLYILLMIYSSKKMIKEISDLPIHQGSLLSQWILFLQLPLQIFFAAVYRLCYKRLLGQTLSLTLIQIEAAVLFYHTLSLRKLL
jgi:hypothetical protein